MPCFVIEQNRASMLAIPNCQEMVNSWVYNFRSVVNNYESEPKAVRITNQTESNKVNRYRITFGTLQRPVPATKKKTVVLIIAVIPRSERNNKPLFNCILSSICIHSWDCIQSFVATS